MSVESLAAVLHHSRAKGTAKLVLVGIANHDGDGGAWPSVVTLAKYAGVDARSVQRAIAKLVGLGELRVAIQEGGTADVPDHRRPNRYHVLVACPPWCDRTAQHRDTRARHEAPLWIDRVTPASPGDTGVRGTGDTGVTQTIPTNHTTPGSSSTTDRAREPDSHPCAVCGQGELRCQLPQGKWALDERHPYTPMAGHHAAR